MTLNGTPAVRAASNMRAPSLSSSVVATTSVAPAKLVGDHAERCSEIGPCGGAAARASNSGQQLVAYTTTDAPAAERSSTFQAAASLPPATTTRLPLRLKKTGSIASAAIRWGRVGRGARSRTVRNFFKVSAPGSINRRRLDSAPML